MRRLLTALAIVAVGSAAAFAAAPATISTVAGTGATGLGPDGELATAVPVDHPRGVGFISGGGYVIAEPFTHVVLRVRADGRAFRAAGTGEAGYSGDGGPATSAQLFGVHGVAAMPDGGFVLADTGNHRIRRVFPDGSITTVAGTGVDGFSGDGGPATAARISAPRGVATLADGTILIPDTGNNRVRRVSPAGVITTVASGLNLPFGVSPLTGGGFLIADTGNNRIRRVAANGTLATVAPADGLNAPHAVAALPDGGYLVADTSNNRVLRVSAGGAVTKVAGTGAAGYSGDGGSAATAALNLPKALAVLADLTGFLVGDSGNNRMRRVKVDLRPALVLRIPDRTIATTSGRPAALRYTLSERAASRLEVLRRGAVVLNVRQAGKPGANVLRFGAALASGTYALRLRATATGARAAAATASLTVRKR